MLRARARARHEGGFTLIELILSISILGIVSTGLVAVMVGALAVNSETSVRLTETRDVQFVTAYLADDVEGATSVVTGGTAQCGTESPVLELRGVTFDASTLDARVTSVSYVLRTATVDGVATGQLHRLACEAAASGGSTPLTPATDVVVARSLVTANPVVTCTPSPCGATTTRVALALTSISGGAAVTVEGTRRTTP
jgi:prepilin-type N-terminal cleavage/methylation domain-containing protein